MASVVNSEFGVMVFAHALAECTLSSKHISVVVLAEDKAMPVNTAIAPIEKLSMGHAQQLQVMRVSIRDRESGVQIGFSDLRLNLHTIDLNHHVSFSNRQGLYKKNERKSS